MFVLNDWLIDPASRRATRGAQTVRLSPKAMAVLETLRAASGAVLSRQELLGQVWPGVTVGEEVLTHAIAELRRALGDDRRRPRYIETVHKSGYRLIGDEASPVAGAAVRDIATYATYLQGSELFFRGGQHNVELAVRTFGEMVAAEPTNVLGHVGMVRALFLKSRYFGGGMLDQELLDRHAHQAMVLAPARAEAHASMGVAHAAVGRHQDALASFATSVRLDPHGWEAHYLMGRICLSQGDYRLAALMLERAATLRADDFHSQMLAAKARRFLEDEVQYRRNLVLSRQRIEAHVQAAPDDLRALTDLAFCAIELGDTSAGMGMTEQLLAGPDDGHFFYLVCALARVGEKALALDTFEKIIEHGWKDHAWLAHDRDIDSLRQEPRFGRLQSELQAA